jgi:uncharacterized protein (TIGR03435 family)
MWRGSILLLLSIAALAQPKFELASVRRSGPPELGDSSSRHGGPGTADPENITYHRMAMVLFISEAYGVDYDQIFCPEWVGADNYEVKVKVPPGTSKEQLRLMWQDLLAERFHLKIHVERRPFPIYELSLAKGGVKFKPAGTNSIAPDPGFLEPAPGMKYAFKTSPRNVKMICRGCSMADLALRLAWPLGTFTDSGGVTGARISDKTGLDGLYDFKLEFAGTNRPGGTLLPPLPDGQFDSAPPFFDAIREQLGLNLIEKKGLLDAVVVDHADKIPTEN